MLLGEHIGTLQQFVTSVQISKCSNPQTVGRMQLRLEEIATSRFNFVQLQQ